MMKNLLILVVVLMITQSCDQKLKELPIIGDREDIDGNKVVHAIAPFSFTNQLGQTIQNKDLLGKTYMVDFFFLSCPTICPIVKKQMLRIYQQSKDMEDVLLVSHTIDPKRDNVEALKNYSDNLGVDHNKWLFLTGNKEELMDIADDYFISVNENENAPGGFDHSGKIILVDRNGKIRSFCDGTETASVDQLMKDLQLLIKEYERS